MKAVNLIPARRIIARQRSLHVRRAVTACSAWAVVIAGVCATGQGLVPGFGNGSTGNLGSRLEKATREVEVNQQTVAVLREELSSVQTTLRATRGIANQPDWSILLALLGKSTGDDVMLRSLDLQPGASASAAAKVPAAQPLPGKAATTAAVKPPAFVLNLSGLAQTQPAVTQYVLRLERAGLFSRVTLLDTSREPFRDGEATSFRLECVIDGAAGVSTQPAAAGKGTR